MALAQEGGDNARYQQQEQPGREIHDGNRERDGGDDLLQQPPDRLDHPEAVGGLYPGPLQAVVEHRVFVGGEIQFRGVPHHFDADVARVLVGEQRIEIVEKPG